MFNPIPAVRARALHDYQKKMAIFTASVLTTLLATARVPADEVTRLPGWKGKLPSEHFSGYLNVGNLSKVPG